VYRERIKRERCRRDGPTRIRHSRWHLTTCRRVLMDTSCQQGSRRETADAASALSATAYTARCSTFTTTTTSTMMITMTPITSLCSAFYGGWKRDTARLCCCVLVRRCCWGAGRSNQSIYHAAVDCWDRKVEVGLIYVEGAIIAI